MPCCGKRRFAVWYRYAKVSIESGAPHMIHCLGPLVLLALAELCIFFYARYMNGRHAVLETGDAKC